MSLLSRFEEFLTQNALVERGTGVLVAVSGGVDSMVLLDLFRTIASEWDLTLSLAHMNHGLRGEESDGDEEFVKNFALEAGLRIFSTRIDIPGFQSTRHLSRQEAARILRYEYLQRARKEAGADVVATGHQANDNAETVLMNALRGAGIRGLSGIPLRREPGIIRPLLFASRADIEAYAHDRGIRYREDSSNLSRAYRRNSLRLDILPVLGKELQTDPVKSLNRLSSLMRSLNDLVERESARVSPTVIFSTSERTIIALEPLRAQPLFLQEELVLSVFRKLEIEPSESKVASVLALGDQPSGRVIDLSRRYQVLRDRDALIVSARELVTFEQEIKIGGTYDFPGFRFSVQPTISVPRTFGKSRDTAFADADLLGNRLVLRSWREGDWFIPLGMHGRKKLSDFFVNSKISRVRKPEIPILESDGAIVWVCGLRLDNRFRVSPATRRAVQFIYEPKEQTDAA
ncbi:MAG: tRNA(Ile)-lysidine synthase [Bacteroidia bacterium]|nr:MAG: tRNA(Ile)-lysidine synthase [Bacteroidia bacterium]